MIAETRFNQGRANPIDRFVVAGISGETPSVAHERHEVHCRLTIERLPDLINDGIDFRGERGCELSRL